MVLKMHFKIERDSYILSLYATPHAKAQEPLRDAEGISKGPFSSAFLADGGTENPRRL